MTTFHETEISLDAGRPVRLYQFLLQTARWSYTSADRIIEHLGVVYTPAPISDDGVRQSGEVSADTLKIKIPGDLAVARLYRGVPPSTPVAITVYQRHIGVGEYVVVWAGDVTGCRWKDAIKAELACVPLTAKMGKTGLRLAYTRNCPHSLYSQACSVNREKYKVELVVQGLTGATISHDLVSTYPEGHFTGGLVEWLMGGWTERRCIEAHTGNVLKLLGGSHGLLIGQPIRIYPGCRQTVESCKKFENLLNYGGIPHLAGESPFGKNIF